MITPAAGGAAPAGNWNGAALNFNTDPTGGAAGTITATTCAGTAGAGGL